jgi:AcrR family transcriptional regulator
MRFRRFSIGLSLGYIMPRAPAKKTYHHGDLRNALIQTGVLMLRDVSPAELSLRELAKRAGVSHNAPYQHFEDREALIAAIAEQGFDLLVAGISEALAQAGSAPLTRLHALRAYVRFAHRQPRHFYVMFSGFKTREHPALTRAAERSRDQLIGVIQEAQDAGLLVAGAPYDIGRVFWAQLHGIAAIAGAGLMASPDACALDTMIDRAFDALLNGLRMRSR